MKKPVAGWAAYETGPRYCPKAILHYSGTAYPYGAVAAGAAVGATISAYKRTRRVITRASVRRLTLSSLPRFAVTVCRPRDIQWA